MAEPLQSSQAGASVFGGVTRCIGQGKAIHKEFSSELTRCADRARLIRPCRAKGMLPPRIWWTAFRRTAASTRLAYRLPEGRLPLSGTGGGVPEVRRLS